MQTQIHQKHKLPTSAGNSNVNTKILNILIIWHEITLLETLVAAADRRAAWRLLAVCC